MRQMLATLRFTSLWGTERKFSCNRACVWSGKFGGSFKMNNDLFFMKSDVRCKHKTKLTTPSPMLWTTQGRCAVDPIWAWTTVEFSVPKVIGRVGGRSTSSGFRVRSSVLAFTSATSACIPATGHSVKIEKTFQVYWIYFNLNELFSFFMDMRHLVTYVKNLKGVLML